MKDLIKGGSILKIFLTIAFIVFAVVLVVITWKLPDKKQDDSLGTVDIGQNVYTYTEDGKIKECWSVYSNGERVLRMKIDPDTGDVGIF